MLDAHATGRSTDGVEYPTYPHRADDWQQVGKGNRPRRSRGSGGVNNNNGRGGAPPWPGANARAGGGGGGSRGSSSGGGGGERVSEAVMRYVHWRGRRVGLLLWRLMD